MEGLHPLRRTEHAIRFSVEGTTAAEIDSQARAVLEAYGHDYEWTWSVSVTPKVHDGTGRVLTWHGDVDATAHTEKLTQKGP
jgi:Xaa-Pro aminopeptidase